MKMETKSKHFSTALKTPPDENRTAKRKNSNRYSYDLQVEGDKIRANKKVDEDEQIAISMLAEERIEKLKTKEEK